MSQQSKKRQFVTGSKGKEKFVESRKAQVWGYIRVSSKGQNLDRQYDAMKEVGIDEDHIIRDKCSGRNFDRPGYRSLLRKLKPGDTVCVQSLDRLGRNYEEVPLEWNRIVREKQCDIRVLDMELLSTRRNMSRMEYFFSHVMLMITSFLASEERYRINARQREGIRAAKARGVVFGRRPEPLPANFNEVLELYRCRELSGIMAASRCGMKLSTFYKKARKLIRGGTKES